MSRITGWVDRSAPHASQLATMTAGYPIARAVTSTWTATPEVTIAQTRRAPYAGTAPDIPVDRDVAAVADADLTNGADLRRDLLARGAQLRSGRDDELILHAYLHWDTDAVDRLHGAFAAAIWDARTRRLLLLRDRFGIRPLHYARLPGGGLVFASTITALLTHPAVPAKLTPNGLAQLLLIPEFGAPGQTPLRDIATLPPGHLAVLYDGDLTIRRWWQMALRSHRDDQATAARTLDHLLHQTITSRVAGQPTVTVATAGGVGSITLAAHLADHPAATRCSSVRLRSPTPYPYLLAELAERRRMDTLTTRLGAEHLDLVYGTGQLLADEVPTREALDLPDPTGTAIPQHLLLAGLAARGEHLVLLGHGVDELLGARPPRHHPTATSLVFPPYTHVSLLRPEARRLLDDTIAYRFPAPTDGSGWASRSSPVLRHRRATFTALTRRLPTDLERLDQLATAAGTRLALPYLDAGTADYLWNLPVDTIKGGGGLGLLGHAAAHRLPETLTWRATQGWPSATLLPQWRANRRLQLTATLADPASPLPELLHVERVVAVAQQPSQAFDRLSGYLVELDQWLRRRDIALP